MPPQRRCWTATSKRVSAAAARPVAQPVKITADQNRTAPGRSSVERIMEAFLCYGIYMAILNSWTMGRGSKVMGMVTGGMGG